MRHESRPFEGGTTEKSHSNQQSFNQQISPQYNWQHEEEYTATVFEMTESNYPSFR